MPSYSLASGGQMPDDVACSIGQQAKYHRGMDELRRIIDSVWNIDLSALIFNTNWGWNKIIKYIRANYSKPFNNVYGYLWKESARTHNTACHNDLNKLLDDYTQAVKALVERIRQRESNGADKYIPCPPKLVLAALGQPHRRTLH